MLSPFPATFFVCVAKEGSTANKKPEFGNFHTGVPSGRALITTSAPKASSLLTIAAPADLMEARAGIMHPMQRGQTKTLKHNSAGAVKI